MDAIEERRVCGLPEEERLGLPDASKVFRSPATNCQRLAVQSTPPTERITDPILTPSDAPYNCVPSFLIQFTKRLIELTYLRKSLDLLWAG